MSLLRILGSPTRELIGFLKEWDSVSRGITAHTSGSTGVPKPIMLSRVDMMRSARITSHFFNIGKDSILGLPLSVSYIAGKMMAVRAMVSNASLYIEQPSNTPLKHCNCKRISLLSVVPSQIPYLLHSGLLKRIDALLIGGSPLAPELENQILDAGYRHGWVSYGMTETCSHVALRPLGCDVYQALEGICLSTDSRGCLVVEAPAMDFSSVVTNDIVEIIDETHFRWLGRIDNVVISGGIKLFPEQIERKISALITDIPYLIVGRKSEKWGNELILKIESAKPIEHLSEQLREVLSPVEMPKEIVYCPQLPRTDSGKLIRK